VSVVRQVLFVVLMLFGLGGMAHANPLLLVNSNSGEVLFEQDAGVPWHPASLTKLMTAYVAFSAIASGSVTLETPVVISRNAWNVPPSKSGLEVDSRITMQDALYLLVVKSANDVAVAIAETVGGSQAQFVTMMNSTAQQLGLTATHYENPHGLHHDGQVTSARDLAILTLYIRQQFPQYLPMFQTQTVVLGKASFETNNDLLTKFAGTTGMKTGYICASGLNVVATVDRGGVPMLGVVLGGASARERGEMAAQMFLRGMAGTYKGSGKSVTAIPNKAMPPADMRADICGKNAKAFQAQREAVFPLGLAGQPSYLTDEVSHATYVAHDLGRVRDIPYPMVRPAHMPAPRLAAVEMPSVQAVPPAPRSSSETTLPRPTAAAVMRSLAVPMDPRTPFPLPRPQSLFN